MAYSEDLALRIRGIISLFPKSISSEFNEKKMFGGLAFLFKGKMTVGVIKSDLMVRVVSEKMPGVLQENSVRPMDFTKRPMKEFIYVDSSGYGSEQQLQLWVELGLEHAKTKLKLN